MCLVFMLGREFQPGRLASITLAQAVDVNHKRLKTMALELAEEVAAAVNAEGQALGAQTGPTEQAAIGRIVQWVESNSGKLRQRLSP